MFHIFANQASLSADTNGNLAVKILNGSNDFGTRGDSYNLSSGDIYYIQQLDKNLQSNAFRNKTFNHVVLGKDVNVSIENNKVSINDITMDNLKPEDVYQDINGRTYINFSDVFQQLISASTSYTSTTQTKDVISNYSDMNNRYIDVSGVAAGTQIIYVNVPFEYLSYPQPITIKGISNSLTGPTIVINVTGIPDGNQYISTQVQLNYIDGTNALPNSEGHKEPNHVLWNLGTGGQTFNFSSGRFMGSILAPNATINAGVNIDGNIVANIVNITGGESHRWDIHPQPTQPTQPMTHGTTQTSESQTVNETIHYVYKDGTTAHDDYVAKPVEFTREVSTDAVTGEKTYGSWSADQSFAAVTSPELKGYTADKAQIDKQTVNGDSKDLEFTVTYTKNAPTITTEKKTVNETIHYQGTGNQTPADHTASVDFTRQVSTDAVTGEKTYGPWSAAQSFDAVTSPELKGYTADKTQIDKQTVNGDSKDLEFTVTYTKNAPTITTEKKTVNETVSYVDQNGHVVAQPHTASVDFTRQVSTDAVTGEKTYGPWSAAQSFDAVTSPELKGYTADKTQIDKQTVNGDSKDLEFTVTYTKNAPTITTEKKIVNETVSYVDQNGHVVAQPHTDSVNFTRTVVVDNVTGEVITSGAGTTAWTATNGDKTFDAVVSPMVPGAVADKAQTAAVTDLNADSADVNETVTYTKVGSLVPSSSDGNFSGAPKVVYPNDPSDATKVTPASVPTVPGYTAHDPEGDVLTPGSSYQPSDPTKDTTITYTADKQKGSVSYVDDTTRKTLKTDSISGTTGSKSSYSTSGSIADYKKQGYELVTDGYPADLTFDNNDTADQNFTVHLKHQNIQSTEAKTVKETIHYQGAGNQTPADNTAQVSFTRQVSTDAVTGEKTYGSWSADQSFAAVTSPVIKGYTPDQAEIGAQTVSGDASDLDFTVVYTKDAPTKPVNPSQPTTPAKPVNPSQPATPTKPVQAGQAAATNFVNQRLPQTGETDQQHMTLSGLLLLAMSSLLGLFGMTKRQRKE
ncbi:mucin-binding protein [Lactobacillus delbrueckii]|uniref:mucin-binding protein n=1 Tax=Lactobacillus delbrueckii TaxID=1584 RepID=UPI001E399F9A|nr:collagen-binding domain-containing protein [Lactobacillus delbrueckii]MCD5492362.1 LPXTG cell wall anchor domain-containing protein [Lactobacillus delbrueckii subsp. lactis]